MIHMNIRRVVSNQNIRLAVSNRRLDEPDNGVMVFILEPHAPEISDIGLLHSQDGVAGCNAVFQLSSLVGLQ